MGKRELAALGQSISAMIILIGFLIEFSLPGVEDFLPSLFNIPTEDMSSYAKKIMSMFIIIIIGEIIGNISAIIIEVLGKLSRSVSF